MAERPSERVCYGCKEGGGGLRKCMGADFVRHAHRFLELCVQYGVVDLREIDFSEDEFLDIFLTMEYTNMDTLSAAVSQCPKSLHFHSKCGPTGEGGSRRYLNQDRDGCAPLLNPMHILCLYSS